MPITDGAETVKLIQDYAAQYCVSKSLPLTAAVMALDCVSVAIVEFSVGVFVGVSVGYLVDVVDPDSQESQDV